MIGNGQLLIERYLVIKQLGSGGFSKTYLARDKNLPNNPLCIVKQLHFEGHNTLTLEDTRQIFKQEADVLHTLGRSHSQIPGLLAYIEDDHSPCLIEEYIEGENLETYILHGNLLQPAEAMTWLKDILATLAFIHSHQIIHQDIKPSNLIRKESDKKIAVIDFGAAVHPDSPPFQDLTFGTPGYVPAEQRAGESVYSSDLYALGITVIQLLTGVDAKQIKRHPVSSEVEWDSYLKGKSIPIQLKEVLSRMVKINAANRYQSATAALAALNEDTSTLISLKPENLRRSIQNKWRTQLIGSALVVLGIVSLVFNAMGSKTASDLSQRIVSTHLDDLWSKRILPLQFTKAIAIHQPIEQILATAPHKIVMVNRSNQIQVLNLETGEMGQEIENVSGSLDQITVSPNGKWLFGTRKNGEVAIWDLSSGQQVRSLTPATKTRIEAAAFSKDSGFIATGDSNHQMQTWNVTSGKIEQSIREKQGMKWDINAMFYASPKLLICATTNNRLMLWDLQTGSLKRILLGHTSPVETVQVSPDGQTLYSFGSDRGIIWDIEANKILHVMPDESAKAISVRWNNDQLVSLHQDGSVRLWNPKSGALIKTLVQVKGIAALSPDAQYITSYNNQVLKIWKLNLSASKTYDVPTF